MILVDEEPYITTFTGKRLHFLNPHPDEICIVDIAHGLAHLCRYVGQCKFFYSVAQHSVQLAWHIRAEYKLEALLHDGAEAYLGDLASPIKRRCPEYKAICAKVEEAIRAKFGLPLIEADLVKEFDTRIRLDEARVLFSNDTVLSEMPGEPLNLQEPITQWPTWHARRWFLNLYSNLTGVRLTSKDYDYEG